MNLTPNDLITILGSSGATMLVVQLIVKPYLKAHPVAENVYPLFINTTTLILASLFVALGLYALDEFSRVSVVQGILTALGAAVVATGAYEVQDNLKTAIKR